MDINRGIVNDTLQEAHMPSMDEESQGLLDVGIIRITDEEMNQMPTKTAHLYGGEEGYAGVLEVFHQLHCLASCTDSR